MQDNLIIFDCDGVLVDSEPLSNAVIAEQISELGIEMSTEEAIHEFAGTSLGKVKRFLQERGKSIPIDFEDIYRQRSYSLFKEALQPVPGIQEIIQELKHNKCVASNGPLEKVRLNLNLTQLVHHFAEEHLFSAYEIQRWKPDPALYLHAAEKMGFAPENCLVIEDSHHGVEAALAAGMQVFGFAGRTPRTKLERPGVATFTDMRQLPGLVAGLGW